MNADAVSRARATLAELRSLLPNKAATIDALETKLGGSRDGLAVSVTSTVTLLPRHEGAASCR